MSDPYRGLVAADAVEAPTRDGRARLEIGPTGVVLTVAGKLPILITDQFLTVKRLDRRRARRRSVRIRDGRLAVARAYPTADLGLWLEPRPGVATRVAGLRPVELLDAEGLAASRDLEHLLKRMAAALASHGRGTVAATELGQGADRVLLLDDGDKLELFARPLFREWTRRVLVVSSDGTVVVIRRRGGHHRTECRSRFGVTVLGDRIRFAGPRGEDRASVWLPWIAPEDRRELARRIGDRLDDGER